MNENISFERTVAGHIADEGVAAPSDAFYDELLARADRHGQRPRWLALIKEPPMRTNSRLAVGSPTARVAAIMVATLLIAITLVGAGLAGSRLLAAEGPIVVAQDGSGDYTTINEAVSKAAGGDTVLIRPGAYIEAVAIDKDITVTGDGSRDKVMIEAPEGGPTSETGVVAARPSVQDQYAILIADADATVSGLTLRGAASAMHVRGGAPTLTDLAFVDVGAALDGDPESSSVVLTRGTRAVLRASSFSGGGNVRVYDRSEPIIEDNTFMDGSALEGGYGDGAVVRGNTIRRPAGNGIVIASPTKALFEDNTLEFVQEVAFFFWNPTPDYQPTIRGNTILCTTCGTGAGLDAGAEGNPTIIGNRFVDIPGTAITVGSDAVVADNELQGNDQGIFVRSGAPILSGNDVSGGSVGISIWSGASPELTGNTICDNGTNIALIGDAEMPATDDNVIARGCPGSRR